MDDSNKSSPSPSPSLAKKHVRPTVRSARSQSAGNSTILPVTSTAISSAEVDPAVEETRQLIETWVGIQPSKTQETKVQHNNNNEQSSTGILRQPKYSGRSENMVVDDDTSAIASASHVHQEPKELHQEPKEVPRPIIRDVVMERPKRKAQRKVAPDKPNPRAGLDPTAIEGYTPTTMPIMLPKTKQQTKTQLKTTFAADTKQSPTAPEDTDPLVFNSLADLMEAAGTLPPNDWNSKESPKVVEAELSFSCMDPDDYQEQERQLEEEEQSIDQDEEDQDDDEDAEEEPEENQEDGGLWTDFFSNEDEEEPVEPREEKAFLKLWYAISHWVTPEAVQYVGFLNQQQQQQQETDSGQDFVWDTDWVPQVDRSDIGASRCAGLMAVLQMHIPRCLQELGRSMEDKRIAERRLADLLRCWDYGRPSVVKLDTKLARALTCVLLETVLVVPGRTDAVVKLPVSCQAVEMKVEEYRYLTRSAIINFVSPIK